MVLYSKSQWVQPFAASGTRSACGLGRAVHAHRCVVGVVGSPAGAAAACSARRGHHRLAETRPEVGEALQVKDVSSVLRTYLGK